MLDNNLIHELDKKSLLEDNPFPHIIVNNILPMDIVKKAENEFFNFDKLVASGGYRYGNLHRNFGKFNEMPSATKEIITFFYLVYKLNQEVVFSSLSRQSSACVPKYDILPCQDLSRNELRRIHNSHRPHLS